MPIDFSVRSNEPELMDDLESGGDLIIKTLEEIDFINKWLGGNSVTTSGINVLLKGYTQLGPLKIVDFGCGDGKMMILMANWFRKKGIDAELIGVDANPHIIDYAKSVTKNYPEIEVHTGSVFDNKWTHFSCDIVTSTLFTHHFNDSELKNLFNSWSGMTNLGVVINDLHRHWFAYYSIRTLTQLFSKSKMVKYDAPLSVLRGFSKSEIAELIPDKRSSNYLLQWKWAFRWQLIMYSMYQPI